MCPYREPAYLLTHKPLSYNVFRHYLSGLDIDIDARLTDHLITGLVAMHGTKLGRLCDAILIFAASDKGCPERELKRSATGELVGNSVETKAIVKFADLCIGLISRTVLQRPGAETLACRLVGHAFQLLTGLLVEQSKSRFATKSGGMAFEAGKEGETEEDPDMDLSKPSHDAAYESEPHSHIPLHSQGDIAKLVEESGADKLQVDPLKCSRARVRGSRRVR